MNRIIVAFFLVFMDAVKPYGIFQDPYFEELAKVNAFHLGPTEIDNIDFGIQKSSIYPDKEAAPRDVLILDHVLMHKIIEYFDYISIFKFIRVCKNFEYLTSTFIEHVAFSRTKFTINIPRGLLIPTFIAFFTDSRDYSRFCGLEGRVISIEDFSALNFVASFIFSVNENETKFSDFIPGIETFNPVNLLDLDDNDFTPEYPLKLNAQRYLTNLALMNSKILSGNSAYIPIEYIPYTLYAISKRSNQFQSIYEAHVISYSQTISGIVLKDILVRLPENRRSAFAKQVLIHGFQENWSISDFDEKLNICTDYIELSEEDEHEIDLKPAILLKNYTIFHNLPNKPSSVFNSLFIDDLHDRSVEWLEYFLNKIPEHRMARSMLAFKYLVETDEAIDYEYFEGEFGDAECLSYCFDRFISLGRKPRIDVVKALIRIATQKFDLSIPHSGCLSLFSRLMKLHLRSRNNLRHAVDYLTEIRCSISFSARSDHENAFQFPAYYWSHKIDSLYPYMTSHFDLLFADVDDENINRILEINDFNKSYNLRLSDFKCPTSYTYLRETIKLFSQEHQEISNSTGEWPYLFLAILNDRFKLVKAIIQHQRFNRQQLLHSIHGIDIHLILSITSRGSNHYKELENIQFIIWKISSLIQQE